MEIMVTYDVVLINTPFVRHGFNLGGVIPLPHLGLGYLGAVLEQAGRRVGYLDAQNDRLNPSLYPAALPAAGAYLLTANMANLPEAHAIAAAIRRQTSTPVALGGPCNIIAPEILFDQFPVFDLLATGEGESMVAPLVDALTAGNRAALEKVPGVAWRDGDRIRRTEPAPPADLTDGLRPLRRLWVGQCLRLHPPYGAHGPATFMETARGCSYHCRFCCISKIPRMRPVAHVLAEARELAAQGVREVHIVDPTFTLDEERTLELCAGLAALPQRLIWSCKTRPDHVPPHVLRAMAAAGCYMIAYGIESAAEEVLAQVDKPMVTEQTARALTDTQAAGIRSVGYALVGSPGETDATIAATNRFVRRQPLWFMLFSIYLPLPEPSDMVRAAEIVRHYTTGRSSMFAQEAPAGFAHRTLNRWLVHSVLGFYLYPPTVVRIVRGLGSWREATHYLFGAALLGREVIRFMARRLFRPRRAVVWSDAERLPSEPKAT
jgi:radical SAM superfamily enzyme YgiQ (UPF0313 family)